MNGAIKYAQDHGHEGKYTCDDIGNSQRFADMHRGKALYVGAWGWMIYDGTRWRRDQTGRVVAMAEDVAQSIFDDQREVARNPKREAEAKQLARHAFATRSRGRLDAMLYLAQSKLAAVVEDFDAQHHLLNCQNGTLNLETMTLQPHDPADKITRICKARYNPEASAQLWQETLQRFLPDEIAAYLQRVFGLTLSGQPIKKFWFLHGASGNNGKSTLTSAVAHVLGDYAGRVSVETLTASTRSPGQDDQLAAIAGARFVVTNEVDRRKLNARLIKDLSGEMDKITVKYMGRQTFSYQPRFKLMLYGNERPELDAQDNGLWNRIASVPFERAIAKGEQIPNFSERLQAESDGILAWMAKGYEEYKTQGLADPPAVLQETQAYRAEMDTFAEFIAECCVIEADAFVTTAALHEKFKGFTGEKIGAVAFGRSMSRLGYAAGKWTNRSTGKQARGFRGVRLAE